MNVIVVIIIVAILLFLGAFFSRRRFGLLGLALTAGATLSTLWSQDAGYLLSATGLISDGPLTNAVALSIVVLLPAIVLLFHGYTYKTMFGRIIGATLFMVLAVAFLVEPLGYALNLSGGAAEIYEQIVANKGIIVSAGVVIAIIDLFFTKPAKSEHDKKH